MIDKYAQELENTILMKMDEMGTGWNWLDFKPVLGKLLDEVERRVKGWMPTYPDMDEFVKAAFKEMREEKG